jgi:hypothetical protein
MNHYFIENIQKMREDESRKELSKRIHQFLGVDPDHPDATKRRRYTDFDTKSLLDALVQRTEVDMGRFAAIEAVNAMLAYYKASNFAQFQ